MIELKDLTQEMIVTELFRRIDFASVNVATSADNEFANLVPSIVVFREAVQAEAVRRQEAATQA